MWFPSERSISFSSSVSSSSLSSSSPSSFDELDESLEEGSSPPFPFGANGLLGG
jgi:hypothetical protein